MIEGCGNICKNIWVGFLNLCCAAEFITGWRSFDPGQLKRRKTCKDGAGKEFGENISLSSFCIPVLAHFLFFQIIIYGYLPPFLFFDDKLREGLIG